MLTVGSTFTGVGGADLGFEWAGFEISWQCELDPWKRSVLAAHWPDIPIYEDVTELADLARDWVQCQLQQSGGDGFGGDNGAADDTSSFCGGVDVLIGGFPCQDLSVAGKRKGFNGERSVLAFEFLRLAESLKPRWLVLENVPGLLSSNKGLDFQRLLSEVVASGYGVGWRCLDARYWGVPQRRRRIFIVARRAEAGVNPRDASGLALRALCEGGGGDSTPCVPSWQETAESVGGGADEGRIVGTYGSADSEIVGTLTRKYGESAGQDIDGGVGVVAFSHTQGLSEQASEKAWPTLRVGGSGQAVAEDSVVRRLTPTECERLMAWPDNHTAPEGIKAPDSRRYAACGDGIVANVAYWIAQRIKMIEGEA